MSKIDELIKELCPNGVEYKKINEIGETFTGLSGKSKKDFESGNCRYITYTNIYNNPAVRLDKDDFVNVKNNEKQNYIIKGDILITGSSENIEDSGMIAVVTEEPKEKIYLNSFCFGLRLNNKYKNKIIPGYSKHIFRSTYFRNQILKCSFGVTRYNLNKKMFLELNIPIPPLEVQEEIVKILDRFSELEAELEAELETRQYQYEFWRENLLNPKDKRSYKSYNICEITEKIFAGGDVPGDTIKGMTAPKGEYIYPVISNGVGKNAIYGYSKSYKVSGNTVTISARGTVGYHTSRIGKYTPIIRLITIIPNEKNVLAKYLNYALYITEIESTNGGIQQVTTPMIKKINLNIPPLEEQKRIVNILDKFDKLINDISEGIPAEIELRKKQYEYYRNKLLNFKEVIV